MMKLNELYSRLTRVPLVLDDLVRGVNSLAELIRYKLDAINDATETCSPFVLIFIKAVKVISKPVDESCAPYHGSDNKIISNIPVTMAVYGHVPHIFTFQPDIEIANLEIAVICDISKVRIENMVVANVSLCPSLQAAPLAYFNGRVGPWNRITVDVRLC